MDASTLWWPDDAYIRHVVATHLDPDGGTPYWLDRDRRLGAGALGGVQCLADFKRLVGFRDAEDQRRYERDARTLPLETFIPRSVLATRPWIWASQTGGTTGLPKHGNWDSEYWETVMRLSDEFLDAHGVPRGVNWLYISPCGPHTIGRMIISLTERRGGRCFTIDLDPRIIKIFGSEGMDQALARYLRHIWDQVEAVVRYQTVGVVYATARLLDMLPEYLDVALFSGVRAFVHAGIRMHRDSHRALREDVFPGVPVVGMYGTSTTGVSYQKPFEAEDDYRLVYVPSAPSILLDVVGDDGVTVDYGAEGDVAMYRLTEDSLIPGFRERDRAVRVAPYGQAAARYPWDWVADVYSPEFVVEGKFEGVY